MRLTLTLHDYIDKYLDIINSGQVWCPICYDDVMSDSREKNMRHMIDCYKVLKVEEGLRQYKRIHDKFPDDLVSFSKDITSDVKNEMMEYYIKFASQEK